MEKKQYNDRYDDLFIDIDDMHTDDPRTKRNRSWKTLIIIIGVIALIAAGVFVLQFWKIDRIEVEGLETISEDYVLSLGGLRTGVPIYAYRPSRWTEAIEVDPHISVESVQYEFPNKAIIKIHERREYAVIQASNQYVYIDREGHVLDISALQKDPSMFVIRGLSITGYEKNELLGVRDEYQLYVLTQLLEALSTTEQRGWYIMADITNPVEIAMRTNENMVVRFGSIAEIEKKLINVSAVLNKLKTEHQSGGVLDAIQVNTINYAPSEKTSLASPSSEQVQNNLTEKNDDEFTQEETPTETPKITAKPTAKAEESDLFDAIPLE